MARIETRLTQMNLILPAPLVLPSPNRTSAVLVGAMLYVSGHGAQLLDNNAGVMRRGRVGSEVSEEQAYATARALALKMIATVKHTIGNLDRVLKVVKIVGMINCDADFERQNKVLDGASDLFFEVFGPDVGRHARSSIGVASLVGRQPVEIEGIFHIGSPQ
jgi:enamine deaminase RidA (YjgF/YER057c/UK114 family)